MVVSPGNASPCRGVLNGDQQLSATNRWLKLESPISVNKIPRHGKMSHGSDLADLDKSPELSRTNVSTNALLVDIILALTDGQMKLKG